MGQECAMHSARKPLASFHGARWSWMMQILSCQAAFSATWTKGRLTQCPEPQPCQNLHPWPCQPFLQLPNDFPVFQPPVLPVSVCCKLWVRERNFCFSWGSLVFLGEEEGAPALHHPAPFGTPKSAAPRCAGHPPTASPWGKVLQTNPRWDIF